MADRTQTTMDKVKELGPTVSLFTLVVLTITLSVTSQISIGNRLDAMQTENNRRFDEINRRFDAMQVESNRRFEATQAENNRRFEAMQAQDTRRFEELNRRFDAMQVENNRRFEAMQAEDNRRFDALNRRFDELFEALRIFERRISRLEGQVSPVE